MDAKLILKTWTVYFKSTNTCVDKTNILRTAGQVVEILKNHVKEFISTNIGCCKAWSKLKSQYMF